MEKFILTVDDLAQMLGVSRVRIYELIRFYGLPARRLKRRILLYRPEVEEWLRSLPYATSDYFSQKKDQVKEKVKEKNETARQKQ